MTTDHQEIVALLTRIAVAVEAMARGAQPARPAAPASGGGGQREEGATAPASDLDGPHGDPVIKYDPKPKYWNGPSFVGACFSGSAPDYLDATAKYLDACAWGAAKDGDERKAGFKRLDASRARGWAARLRAQGIADAGAVEQGGGYRRGPAGMQPAPMPAEPGDGGDERAPDSIPF